MKKLKLLASIVTAVMLVGSITSNASATETKETSYVNTTISSFPTDASLADFAEAFSGDDLEIVSSPLRNVDYQTRAAESVALLRIYSTTGSGSSSSSSNLGHSWLTITNLSGSTTNIAGPYPLAANMKVYGLIWIRRLIQWDRIFKMFPSKFL